MRQNIEKKDNVTTYNISFSSLTDLHDYLLTDPPVNSIFTQNKDGTPRLRASLIDTTGNEERARFYGESLEKALEWCISGYNSGLDDFLDSSRTLKKASSDVLSDARKQVHSLYGGIPIAPLVAANVPNCMVKYVRDSSATVTNIYCDVGCNASTTPQQIINRGLAVLHIVQILEERGELVNFQGFQLISSRRNHHNNEKMEYVNMEIILKKTGDLFLDVEKCYFPLTGKEFLRRILFRVLESMPVMDTNWLNYGSIVDLEEKREFYHLGPNDLLIGAPADLGIEGENLYDDLVTTVEKLGLQDKIDPQKIKKLAK